ncbi:MAG: NifB/NifX family molybdenum-iron cluster-binding protein [Erysipelotrichaceae bacterium]|nr:NifB/NifX family molybdenum-iron cluster-binding protein [Erysipelotrichaceae bacterium]
MRIAVTYEYGFVGQHFGRTEEFKLYDIEDGGIIKEQILSSNGQSHGMLAVLLKEAGADLLICGGIGMGARYALNEAGIELIPGAQGKADDVVRAYLNGALAYDPDASCHHHDHEEGHECHHDHSCGDDHNCHRA